MPALRLLQLKGKDSDNAVRSETGPGVAKMNKREKNKVKEIESEVFQKVDQLVMCPGPYHNQLVGELFVNK